MKKSSTSTFTTSRTYEYELEGLTYIIECEGGQWCIHMPEGLGYPPILDLRVLQFAGLVAGREAQLQDVEELLREVLARMPRSHEQYPIEHLSGPERAVLERCMDLVRRVAELPLVKIVRFTSPDIHGTYSTGCSDPDCGCDAQPNIALARKILEDQKQTLKVLVHEVAHKAGGDNTHAHLMEMQRLWSELVIEMAGAES
jgi:hypothetical protein